MEIKTTYKGINNDGIKCVFCGFKPDGIEVIEEINMLYPQVGYLLQHKETKETFRNVILFTPEMEEEFEEIEERSNND